jgi:tectonin beta-propeller repeat-containing protein 1
MYNTKYSEFQSLASAITAVNTDGLAYYAFMKDKKPMFMSQIGNFFLLHSLKFCFNRRFNELNELKLFEDGHFKLVEKHSSGLTFGLGESGKLWGLRNEKNLIQDSYNGPYTQTDEIELHTYENQRWYIFTSVFGMRNGFTNIGFPSDRYQWSDQTGKISRRKEECVLPSHLFRWSSDWQVDFSLLPGVDQGGWQYAFDFPASYHAVMNPLKDFVRRRRWTRKCKIKTQGMWLPVNQTHKLKSISLDQEPENSTNVLLSGKILMWATDSSGFVLWSLIDKSSPLVIKWNNVPSEKRFGYINIGPNLQVWAIDSDGYVYYRIGIDPNSNYLGTSWSKIAFNEDEEGDEKFKMLSVGYKCIWAVSVDHDLYFREKISKSFPEGTAWVKIASNIEYVTVNSKNQVTYSYFLTSALISACSLVGCASDFDLTRSGVQGSNLGGGRKFSITW